MLLKISWGNKEVVKEGQGYVVVKVPSCTQYASACYVCSVNGSTEEDYDKNHGLKGKTIFVGTKGGISV